MTKEEAIENIKLIRFNAAITNANSFKEALDMAIEALSQQPSLPSNLDKAAEKYAKENCENYVDEEDGVTYIEEALRNTFKAGAEWMAGQGKSFDGIVRDDGFVDFDKYGSSMMIPSNTPYFNNGEKVIIQIRKKQ